MCFGPEVSSLKPLSTSCQPEKTRSTKKQVIPSFLWPIHPWIIVACFPILPTSLYVNRGFTQWFHLLSVVFLVTQSKFLARFQALLGVSICFGWYASLTYECFRHDRWMVALYKNVPPFMVDVMVDSSTGNVDYASWESRKMMVMAHILDLMGHPLLTWYFWRKAKQFYGVSSVRMILTWPVILSTYALSRLWSMFHVYYNNDGMIRPFYIGFDIYVIDSLDSWYPAYIAESLVYLGVVFWKLA